MPSRWERIAGVAPKIDTDRKFLVFIASHYRGEPWLPHPDHVVAPAALHVKTIACASLAIVIIGLAGEPAVTVLGLALLACALTTLAVAAASAAPSIREYRDLRARALEFESRIDSDRLTAADAETLNEMIRCDEGTLSYCAAKIASEIDRDPGCGKDSVGFVRIDLWNELVEIGASARRIAQDREATEQLERGRLRDDPDIRSVITEDKEQRREALAVVAARIHSLADYRDHIRRLSARELRDRDALERVTRLVADEQARDRLI